MRSRKAISNPNLKIGGYEGHIAYEVLPPKHRVVVLGDTHGDLEVVISAFIRAKLIIIQDGCPVWIAKDTALVQVGDQIDSCRPLDDHDCHRQHLFDMDPKDEAEDFYIIRLFYLLDMQARFHGSCVISLIGNHEMLNILNYFRYVSKANMDHGVWPGYPRGKMTPEEYRRKVFKKNGPVAQWLANYAQSVVVIGSSIFVHAGILPEFINKIDHIKGTEAKVKALNDLMRNWLLDKKLDDSLIDDLLDGFKNTISPFWQRIHGAIPNGKKMSDPDCQKYLKPVLETLKLDLMVIGHTPQIKDSIGVNGTCYQGDKPGLVRADGGFSRAFKYIIKKEVDLQLVEIIDDKEVTIKSYKKMNNPELIKSIKKWIDKK